MRNAKNKRINMKSPHKRGNSYKNTGTCECCVEKNKKQETVTLTHEQSHIQRHSQHTCIVGRILNCGSLLEQKKKKNVKELLQ